MNEKHILERLYNAVGVFCILSGIADIILMAFNFSIILVIALIGFNWLSAMAIVYYVSHK